MVSWAHDANPFSDHHGTNVEVSYYYGMSTGNLMQFMAPCNMMHWKIIGW